MGTIFTFFDDDPTLAILGAGGGVASPIQLATVTLSNAQIIAAPTTGIDIVAAPGANRIAVPVSGLWISNTVAAAYGNFGANGYFTLVWGTTGIQASGILPVEGWLDDQAVLIATLTCSTIGDNPLALSQENWALPVASLANQTLKVKSTNALGNFNGGNVANSLLVKVYYIIISTT